MFRFDHDASLSGIGGRTPQGAPADPQVWKPPLCERVAAPAIYWSRMRGMRGLTATGNTARA
jgi:hypothetical protein